MKAAVILTPRETEVAELLAWGSSKKEVACQLSVSPRTVENTARNIYEKIGIQKATELCVWWFCTHFGVSFDLSPIKRQIIAIFLLAVILPNEFKINKDAYRIGRTSKRIEVQVGRRYGRRSDSDFDFKYI